MPDQCCLADPSRPDDRRQGRVQRGQEFLCFFLSPDESSGWSFEDHVFTITKSNPAQTALTNQSRRGKVKRAASAAGGTSATVTADALASVASMNQVPVPTS